MKFGLLAIWLCASAFVPAVALASIQTNSPSLSASTFQRIDSNGVDLISGKFNFKGPRLRGGAAPREADFALSWTGGMWTFPSPSLWQGDDYVLYVNTGESVEEFDYHPSTNSYTNTRGNSSTIACTFYSDNYLKNCSYKGHDANSANFSASSPYVFPAPEFSIPIGNVMASNASWCNVLYCTLTSVYGEGSQDITINGWKIEFRNLYAPQSTAKLLLNGTEIDSISISTPGVDKDHRYGRSVISPDDVVQVMTEMDGSQWRFTFDDQKNLTRIRRPGSVADDLVIQYDSSERVRQLTNAAGTWTYVYGSLTVGSKTTVSKPDGTAYNVTYIKKQGNIRSHTNELNRTTTYDYDSDNRLTKVTAPELNYTAYAYDTRGNVTAVTTYPKPGSSAEPLVVRAEYPDDCATNSSCNKPKSIFDANSNLQQSMASTDYVYVGGLLERETKPAATPNAPRPQVRWTYGGAVSRYVDANGILQVGAGVKAPATKSECLTAATCEGGPDEVRTVYGYGPANGPNSGYLREIAVTHNGETRRTCYEYDARGNRIAERSPRAGLAACYGAGEPPPSFSISDATVTEGGTLVFTITKAGTTTYSYEVRAQAVDGTAIDEWTNNLEEPDPDFHTTFAMIRFAPGEVSKTFSVATFDDSAHENVETFSVNLTTGGSATLSDPQAVGTINDNDASGGGGGGGGGPGGGGGGEENSAPVGVGEEEAVVVPPGGSL